MILMPGGRISFDFGAEPSASSLEFDQQPAVLLLGVLVTTLEQVFSKWSEALQLDKIAKLECFENMVDTAVADTGSLNVRYVSSFFKSVITCIGEFAELSLPAQTVLLLVGAAPQAFASMFMGLIGEIGGGGHFDVAIDKKEKPALRTEVTVLNPYDPDLPEGSIREWEEPGYTANCVPSTISGRDDSARCFVNNNILDPCFPSPQMIAICLDFKDESWILLRLQADSHENFEGVAPEEGKIVHAELEDGTRCSSGSGSGPQRIGTYNWIGVCTDESIWWIDTSDEGSAEDPLREGISADGYWLTKTGPEGGPLTDRKVVKAYR